MVSKKSKNERPELTKSRKLMVRKRVLSLEMNVGVLGTDSNYDEVTKMTFEYRQKNVYPYLEKKGFSMTRCQGPLARRSYVAPEARKPNIEYITGSGHGHYDVFMGDYQDPIFSVGNYSREESQEKIVHFCSCETARDLGPDFTAHGCRAYFGYDGLFQLHKDDSDIFFGCDSEIDLAFADGLTAGKVYERVRILFDKHIALFRSKGQNYKAALLEYDRDHLRAPSSGPQWGDIQARLR